MVTNAYETTSGQIEMANFINALVCSPRPFRSLPMDRPAQEYAVLRQVNQGCDDTVVKYICYLASTMVPPSLSSHPLPPSSGSAPSATPSIVSSFGSMLGVIEMSTSPPKSRWHPPCELLPWWPWRQYEHPLYLRLLQALLSKPSHRVIYSALSRHETASAR